MGALKKNENDLFISFADKNFKKYTTKKEWNDYRVERTGRVVR